VLALGEFQRLESIPLLFDLLEDDLCREEAQNSLRKTPDATRQFGIFSIRGFTAMKIDGPSAQRRRRAILQLLNELGVASEDWPDLRKFLGDDDPGIVISAARIGFSVAPERERAQLMTALFKVAGKFNYVQEEDAIQLLDSHPSIAREAALRIAKHKKESGQQPTWLSPLWRVLNHVACVGLEDSRDGDVG
jgi:hypothetical protein